MSPETLQDLDKEHRAPNLLSKYENCERDSALQAGRISLDLQRRTLKLEDKAARAAHKYGRTDAT